jgi:GT2 family glycosyltransferase
LNIELSIIILNWNTQEDTKRCIDSILESRPKKSIEIILVDNASSDGSRETLPKQFPVCQYIQNSKNIGFGAGNNRGIPAARGKYVFFLNSDTIVTKESLEKLLEFADHNPDAGIIGPKLLNKDGTLQYSCRNFPNLGVGFFRNTPLGRLFPHNRYTQDYLLSDWDHQSVREVDWVSGAALLIRREALDKLKGFDEDFYMYCEDVDLCYRAREAGWKTVYFPDSIIYHIIGRSSDKAPTRMTWFFHQSMYLFYKKHYAKSTSILIRPFILPGLFIRAAGQLIRYKWRNILKNWQKRSGQ